MLSNAEELKEANKVIKTLKKKFEAEVTQGMQMTLSAAEDRVELDKKLVELN